MARVQIARAADEDLAALIRSHDLPADTRPRVKDRLQPLARFPLSGQAIGDGPWAGFRKTTGPWPWMLIVHDYDEPTDTVTVVTIQDGRTSAVATRY